MHKNLKNIIEFQINEVDRLFNEYESFFNDMNYETPDIIQVTVMANILHSFYNGVEKIFERILKDIDNNIPTGNKSHQEILDIVCIETDNRSAVITDDTSILLNEYLGFRHFFRHSYSYQLKWEKMKPLAINLSNTWIDLKIQLINFIEK